MYNKNIFKGRCIDLHFDGLRLICVTASSDVPLYLSYSPSDLLDHRLDVSRRLHSAQFHSTGTAAQPLNTAVMTQSPALSSVDVLQHELSLLHAELMFEKQRREVHARRGRRLLARVNQLSSFADQNEAMVRIVILLYYICYENCTQTTLKSTKNSTQRDKNDTAAS